MHTVKKLFTITAILLSCLLLEVAWAAPSSKAGSVTVEVEVLGTLPGYSESQLAANIVAKMEREQKSGVWYFVAKTSTKNISYNRIVWTFKTLYKGWRGGSHHGFPTDNGKVTYLTAEVKLYLNNAYQMTFSTHSTVSNELDDRELVKNGA